MELGNPFCTAHLATRAPLPRNLVPRPASCLTCSRKCLLPVLFPPIRVPRRRRTQGLSERLSERRIECVRARARVRACACARVSRSEGERIAGDSRACLQTSKADETDERDPLSAERYMDSSDESVGRLRKAPVTCARRSLFYGRIIGPMAESAGPDDAGLGDSGSADSGVAQFPPSFWPFSLSTLALLHTRRPIRRHSLSAETGTSCALPSLWSEKSVAV
jgi:hypothetical protein